MDTFSYPVVRLEDLPFDYYLDLYRHIDPDETRINLNVPFSEKGQYFLVTFFTEKYKIRYPQFSILPEGRIDPVISVYSNMYAKILLLRYLTEGTFQIMSENMMPFRYLPWGDTYDRQFRERCVDRLAAVYARDPDGFCRFMDSLHALPQNDGDHSYDIEIVPGIYTRFILWDGDDEFPASAQILFSDNFPAAFSAEDAAYICGIILDTFEKKTAGLPVQKG